MKAHIHIGITKYKIDIITPAPKQWQCIQDGNSKVNIGSVPNTTQQKYNQVQYRQKNKTRKTNKSYKHQIMKKKLDQI